MRIITQCDTEAKISCKQFSNMAFVAYDHPDQAKEALEAMNGKWIGQRNMIV